MVATLGDAHRKIGGFREEPMHELASKRAPGLEVLDYNERLNRLNLSSLKDKRIRRDLTA